MIRFKGALTFSLASSLVLLGSVAASEARDIKVKRIAPALAVSQVAAVAPTAAVETKAAAVPAVIVPACARKVKVIYAGYGEADRATCTISATNTVTTTR